MRRLTREWIDKAEADFRIATREVRVRRQPSYDGVCFHAQQCAEKYLKARLQEADIATPKIHDLEQLMKALAAVEPEVGILRSDLKALSVYAVNFRYPGTSADRELAREAVQQCGRVRDFIRGALGLSASAARKRPIRSARDKTGKKTSRGKKR
jgi:HEPN domain-containing protein